MLGSPAPPPTPTGRPLASGVFFLLPRENQGLFRVKLEFRMESGSLALGYVGEGGGERK